MLGTGWALYKYLRKNEKERRNPNGEIMDCFKDEMAFELDLKRQVEFIWRLCKQRPEISAGWASSRYPLGWAEPPRILCAALGGLDKMRSSVLCGFYAMVLDLVNTD